MTTIVCDVCGGEIAGRKAGFDRGFQNILSADGRLMCQGQMDICQDCAHEINAFIIDLKAKHLKAKQEGKRKGGRI